MDSNSNNESKITSNSNTKKSTTNKEESNVKRPRRYFDNLQSDDINSNSNIDNDIKYLDEDIKSTPINNNEVNNQTNNDINTSVSPINNIVNGNTQPRRRMNSLYDSEKDYQKNMQAISNFNKNNRPKPKEKDEEQNQNGNSESNNTSTNNPNINKPQGNIKKNEKAKSTKKKIPKTKVNTAVAVAKKIGQVGQALGEAEEKVNETKEKVKTQVKQQAKVATKKRLIQVIMKFILPLLPYIVAFIIAVALILLIIFAVFHWYSDEDRYMDTIDVNYCSNVNLKWYDDELEEYVDITISSDEYIAYLISTSDYAGINQEEAMKALTVIYRTNFYATAGNMDSNTCYYELDSEYVGPSDFIVNAVSATDNKIFSYEKDAVEELPLDSEFHYIEEKVVNSGATMYVLYQDHALYDKEYIDSHVEEERIIQGDTEKYSFPPFAATYYDEVKKTDWTELLYHYLAPGRSATLIRKVRKIGSDGWSGDGYGPNGLCSDISLSSTTLSKEEFVNYVKSNVSNSVFVSNAEKIYDIASANSFNPEMIVIRAKLEGYSPGGSTNNYWGIGCSNNGGGKDCYSYASFDQGVLGYINVVKKINQPTLFAMQRKYTYIGSNWFNPGGSGEGGCYYFPYIRQYMSEERASVVEKACQDNAKCSGTSCIPTTDEDQDAYTMYQIQNSLKERQNIFNISADECTNSEAYTEETGDPNSLGARVAKYAVDTYDSWSYSQDNRHQQGYVDCSSMVSRAYAHFGVRIYDRSDTAGPEYQWCEEHGAAISGSSLQAGDLIFFVKSDSTAYKKIGHVEMFIGNGQKFGAHTARYKQVDQVSVTSYSGNGNYFCRPSLTVGGN